MNTKPIQPPFFHLVTQPKHRVGAKNTVYNSVDSEYIRQTTDKFNERVKEDQMLLNDNKREEILEQQKDEFVADMDDDEFDEILTKLLEERKE